MVIKSKIKRGKLLLKSSVLAVVFIAASSVTAFAASSTNASDSDTTAAASDYLAGQHNHPII